MEEETRADDDDDDDGGGVCFRAERRPSEECGFGKRFFQSTEGNQYLFCRRLTRFSFFKVIIISRVFQTADLI